MLKILEKNPVEQARKLCVHLGGDFEEGLNVGLIKLDNKKGRGRIFTYELMPGLSVKAYDITLTDGLQFRVGGGTHSPIFMLYCLEGHYYHQFLDSDSEQRISRGQNVILSSSNTSINLISLPKNIAIQLSVILVDRNEVSSDTNSFRGGLGSILKDLYSKVPDNESFKHLGGVSSNVEKYAKALVKNRRTDVVGRLITEAAVLNTMAAQLETHEKSTKDKFEVSKLSDYELERLLNAVVDMQRNIDNPHTIALFSKRVGISPKKIQEGFRFLFGQTFASFLKDFRLEIARDLLETTDLQVSQITMRIGIASKSHFSKIFLKRYRMLPRDYRESLINATRSFELTYRSKAATFIGEAEVKSMVEHANEKNQECGVSGCLVYFENQFFQILEGPKREVLKIASEIFEDSRHTDAKVVWKGPRDGRIFKNDGMVLLSDRAIASSLSTGRDLKIDMQELLADKQRNLASSRLFWERIRNRIITAQVA